MVGKIKMIVNIIAESSNMAYFEVNTVFCVDSSLLTDPRSLGQDSSSA